MHLTPTGMTKCLLGSNSEVRELLFWAAVVAVICLIAFIVMLAE